MHDSGSDFIGIDARPGSSFITHRRFSFQSQAQLFAGHEKHSLRLW
jgi:hypothetical protein